jgi:2-polyprenyl-3-methyl-5-hydroxy-6-metoxy-1,4-benzoquinol methylase
MSIIQADFDRIARLSNDNVWNHNKHYHNYLLRHVPSKGTSALDIGCGTGAFSRLLAQRCDQVLGLDLSPEMIRSAQEQSRDYPNIQYEVADVMERDLQANEYDCIATIATLHHLPLREILLKAKQALKPGGVLLNLDLYHDTLPHMLLTSAVAIPASIVLKQLRNGHVRSSKEEQEAWAQHAPHDHYLPLADLRRIAAETLPGARITRHVFWRYSLIWTKGATN